MSLCGQPSWLRRLRLLGIGLHLAFVLIAPFEHHDLLCHLKQPLHCTACVSSPLGASPRPIQVVGSWSLRDAGKAVAILPAPKGILLAVSSTGRSPPVAA
jgi:hypothetical protein